MTRSGKTNIGKSEPVASNAVVNSGISSPGVFTLTTPEGTVHHMKTIYGMVRVTSKLVREHYQRHPQEPQPSLVTKKRAKDNCSWVQVLSDGTVYVRKVLFFRVPNPHPLDMKLPDHLMKIYEEYFAAHPWNEPVLPLQPSKKTNHWG